MALPQGEEIQLTALANLKRGWEYVGGKMSISKEHVYFKPHKFNIQTNDVVFPINLITEMKKKNTLGLVPNGLEITLANGETYRFVTWKRKKIMNYLQQLL